MKERLILCATNAYYLRAVSCRDHKLFYYHSDSSQKIYPARSRSPGAKLKVNCTATAEFRSCSLEAYYCTLGPKWVFPDDHLVDPGTYQTLRQKFGILSEDCDYVKKPYFFYIMQPRLWRLQVTASRHEANSCTIRSFRHVWEVG
jgi:hypothetical protein